MTKDTTLLVKLRKTAKKKNKIDGTKLIVQRDGKVYSWPKDIKWTDQPPPFKSREEEIKIEKSVVKEVLGVLLMFVAIGAFLYVWINWDGV